MLTLKNSSLAVTLLDPADPADQRRQGTRYCWGGYVWQVTDAKAGPIFAGPQWPEPEPTAFNGQGLPESFRHAKFGSGEPVILEDRSGFIIGIGEVAPDASGELAVVRPCDWTMTKSPGSLEFCTSHSGNGYACQLTRRVSLAGRTITSATSLTNTGTRELPLYWFAHPFFALDDRMLTCGLPASWGMAENVGYAFDAKHRLAFKRRFKDVFDGHFEQLVIGRGTPLRAVLSHPKLNEIVFTTDFVPDSCPVWGNSNTWSIEPYIESALAPGASRAWALSYEIRA
ncbi:MAG: hypothetical protein JWM35_2350 [Verrucomicrobia bacterium]|nr:hypothetical protein [Verrucomicrobiota bacterium]